MAVILNTLLPTFSIILLGFFACKYQLVKVDDSASLNRYVYYIAFPALLFVVLANASLDKIFHRPFSGAWGGSLLLTFIVTSLLCRYVWRTNVGEMVIAGINTTCSSTGFMGVYIITILFGPSLGNSAAVAPIIATAFIAIVMISFAMVVLESNNNPTKVWHITLNVLRTLSRNPLSLGSVLGVLSAALWTLPTPVTHFLNMVGYSAIPVPLFALGVFFAGINQLELRKNISFVHGLSFIKLIVHPILCGLLVTYIFNLSIQWQMMAIILAALPPATTCFVIAQRYGVATRDTASMSVLSTAYSLITLAVLLPIIGATDL